MGPLKVSLYELRKTMALSELIEVEASQERQGLKGLFRGQSGWVKTSNINRG
jgi:hypothetical protein